MPGVTIKIYLADGTPAGLRVIERSNWTGKGLDFARADLPKVRVRDDFARPGVYVLHGPGEDGLPRVYVGEADALGIRLGQHFSGPGSKDFWTRATAFTSKDENLNKAHVRYLESRLVELAKAAKRAQLENGNVPTAPALSEADRAEADAFLAEMLVIYPLVGLDVFSRPVRDATAPRLYLKIRGIVAEGADEAEGFVVYEGSQAAKVETNSLSPSMRKYRTSLLQKGVLVEAGDCYRLTQDYSFTSPSTAADVMGGRSSNGREVWKDKQGRTLKAIQEAQTS